MASTFSTWIQGLPVSWMGLRARRIFGGFGAVLGDKSREWAERANLEHLPQSALDPKSVALIASERQIEPGPNELQSDLGARLTAAMTQWQLAGSPLGLALAIYYAEFLGAVLITQNGLAYSITGTPDLADLAGLTTQPSWWTVTTLGNYNPALPASTDGKVAIAANTIPWASWDSGMDAAGNQYCGRFVVLFPTPTDVDLTITANIERIRRVIASWKPAKAKCFKIVVGFSAQVWGWPKVKWNAVGPWSSGTIYTYPA